MPFFSCYAAGEMGASAAFRGSSARACKMHFFWLEVRPRGRHGRCCRRYASRRKIRAAQSVRTKFWRDTADILLPPLAQTFTDKHQGPTAPAGSIGCKVKARFCVIKMGDGLSLPLLLPVRQAFNELSCRGSVSLVLPRVGKVNPARGIEVSLTDVLTDYRVMTWAISSGRRNGQFLN